MANEAPKLAKNVREAILSHESFNHNWKVDLVQDGSVITLIGNVPTQEEAELIESIVKEQKGVLSVNNELNSELTTNIETMYPSSDAEPEGHHIRILTPRR